MLSWPRRSRHWLAGLSQAPFPQHGFRAAVLPALWRRLGSPKGRSLARNPTEGVPVLSTPVLPSAPTDSSFTTGDGGCGPLWLPSRRGPGTSLPRAGLADRTLCLRQFANATGRWLSFSCLFSRCPKPPPLQRQAVPKCERKLLRR